MQQVETASLSIDGVTYFPAADVAREAGISRQTLWRWRQDGKVPAGHRFRNGQILFTSEELQAIREHAHHIEPVQASSKKQMTLFNGRTQEET